MTRSDIKRIILVLGILAPLIYIQIGPGVAPEWLNQRVAGIPGTVIATTLWFITMMGLAIQFAKKQVIESQHGEESES
ncbi:MAG: hypothetical protein CMK32_08835 [Porticoccaceae bacterium]|nr:hypothetical protein [Porticoccaceae bacterium]